MKLFAIYVGGEAVGANIELHDMRFAVAERIEDTYEEMRRQWWGIPESLHIDCWSEITQADGYKVTLVPGTASEQGPKLYYVNLGGYEEAQFTELHKNMFVVAETESKAKVKALKTVRHWDTFHKDDMYQADQAVGMDSAAREKGLSIHLEKIEDESPPSFTCRYKNIAKKPAGS